ncbi:[4Fe-4S] proteins maturation [Elasticomyces elasticus]|nr:[4Fe-4S] proteins maturation [Elasticomyces elasticus]KAK4965123.1 [4Fe-4S] proteins maturation [Elasticomyces elasticus]
MTKQDQLLYFRSPTCNNHIAMALRTTVPTCERAITRCTAPVRVRSSALQRRSIHTSPPLFLDFLAPSWRSQPVYPRARTVPSTSATSPQQRKTFSTAPRNLAKAITNPRKDDDGNKMLITISPRAAHRLTAISEKDGNPDLALRVSVESGGCHGFQYLMSLVNAKEADAAEDTIFEDEKAVKGDYKAKVVMDEPSLELLKGSSIDYTMELIGSQFKVTGIPGAKSSCGCGTSFDIA